jgi:3-hydroxy acid dehydrogenase/malonic semialdehyde reductase
MSVSMDSLIRERLAGQRALITGASAGIGRATALLLAHYGVEVLAVARRKERLDELQKASSLIEPLICDVTDSLGSIESILKQKEVHILVNNAGLAKGRSSVQELNEDDWKTMIETNVLSLLRVTKLVIPQMLKRGWGDIVNLGSIAGLQSYGGGSVYCGTKFAVHAFSEAWRQDLMGTDIRVSEICPGMVETEFSLVRFNHDHEKAKKVYEGVRVLQAEDVAHSILWSVSQPRHVTLQNTVIMPTDQAAVGQIFRGREKGR